MQIERTLQGTHIDTIGPYPLKISYYRIFEFMGNYLTVILKIFFRKFPSQLHSMVFHYPCCRTKSHTYRQCYVRNAVKYGSFVAVFYPHASSDSWLRQSRCNGIPTIRRYGLQHTAWGQIIPNFDGDQNFGRLFLLRYFCSRLWQYHTSSYHKGNPFIAEEVRIVCSCKYYLCFLSI